MRNIFLTVLILLFAGCSNGEDNSAFPEVIAEVNNSNVENSDNLEEIPTEDITENNNSEIIVDTDTEVVKGDEVIASDETMVVGRIYKILKGDKIQEIDDAKVRILKNSETSFFEVILLEGKARILRGAGN